MLAFLKILDARLSEPSTYAGISAILLALNVNVDPGLMHAITLYGTILAGLVAIVLAEVGAKKPALQITEDVIQAVATALRALPVATVTTTGTKS